MNLASWLRIAAIATGALALGLLIWFGGPFLGFGDVRPLDSGWVRGPIVAVVTLGALLWIVWIVIGRKRAAAALADAMLKDTEQAGDGPALRDAMRDALATLRRTRGGAGGSTLYDLPWYMMIGPPGSGKTTAIANSGLKFPLARGTTPEAIAGVGGTRYCDWWFAEDAVLIDTAGRYTTQDSDPGADRASWLSFLDLLKTNRPRQPINGVIVAISLQHLLTASPEEITADTDAIRKRLVELNERLKIEFPVYVMFTKADLVAGFTEFFGGLPEAERRMVWGHTFQTGDKTRNMISEVPGEYDALVERLTERLADKLHDEPNPAARVVLFGLPSQMATLKRTVVDFLTRVFEPTRYHASATLRGFYFVSGTQQGTPIDQLIGALSRSFGSQDVGAQAYSGLGRSYFITDLLRKVIIGESGWVSTDRTAVRRTAVVRGLGFGTVALGAVVMLGLWWNSYARNSELISATGLGLTDYRASAAPVLQEQIISDNNFGKVLPHLQKLRNLPTGYASRDSDTPLAETFGLSQRERLQSAAASSYQVALERMLRPRLIYRLEALLDANMTSPGFVYEGLKVYLMLGGLAKLDRELVMEWMRRDWAESLFPGAGNAKGREALEEHLAAMLDLETGDAPLVRLNQSLIETAQRTLGRMSIAERAYELLRSQARSQSQRDWIVAAKGGSDVAVVFEGTRGEDLSTIRVPFFHTYDGFHTAFIDQLADIGERIERERWVLGASGEQSAVAAQYATLFQDLLKLYTRDFVATWQQTLRRLKLRPLNADKPRYVALSAISAPTSPFKQILESIREETQLTKERPQPRRPAGVADAVRDAAAEAAAERARAAAGRLGGALTAGRVGIDRALGGGQDLGAEIETQFKAFHVLVEGDLGRKPVDQLLQVLSEINQNLAIAATNPQQVAVANGALVNLIATLRASSARYPAPFNAMIVSAVNEFEGDATGTIVALLRQGLAEQVTRTCEDVVANRYPFTRTSAREVPLADFAQIFAPSTGIIDKFVRERLDPYIDRSRPQWIWRQDSRVARALSPATVRELQRAADIRDAFFATGGNLPSFQMVILPTALPADAATARLEINGFTVQSQQGVPTATPVTWPGAGVGRTAITLGSAAGGGVFGGGFFSGGGAQASETKLFERDGLWSFFRLLDAGSMLRQGDNVVLNFAAGGRQVGYQISVGSLKNPLVLPALREFRCPTGL